MLRVTGRVDILVGDHPAQLEAQGSKLVVDVESPRSFLRAAGGYNSASRPTLKFLAKQLHDQGLTVEFRSRGKSLFLLGKDAQPGLVSRFSGLPHFQLVSTSAALSLLFGS
jgi:hypothetical protein